MERLINGMLQYKEALMSAKVIGSGGTELPALQATLQVRLTLSSYSPPRYKSMLLLANYCASLSCTCDKGRV